MGYTELAMGKKKQKPLTGTLIYRLMMYFLIVITLPLALLGFIYLTAGNETIVRNLSEQGGLAADQAALKLEEIIAHYLQKADLLSTDELIVDELIADETESESPRAKVVYDRLFSIMSGDASFATATIVSTSGLVRYSTQNLPPQYNIRYAHNDLNPFFDLSKTPFAITTLLTTEKRYISDSKALIFLNIFVKVRNKEQQDIGYVAVDIHQEAIANLNDDLHFNELILIDSSSFLASSLLNTERHGSFARFAELTEVRTPFVKKTVVEGSLIASMAPIQNTPFYIVGITDTTQYMQSVRQFFFFIMLIVLVGTFVAGFMAIMFIRSISNPVQDLIASMKKVESGDLSVQIKESSILEFAQLDKAFNAMVSQISELLTLTREEEAKVREAERKALQSQMNPHFLYNTLNTVKALAKLHHEEEILKITVQLGKLLRDSIENNESEQSLRESIALVKAYLGIQRIRFGDKLCFSIEIEEEILDVKIPKLLVQPLVENAIIHGLEPKVGQWHLTVKGYSELSSIIVEVIDNGIGSPKEVLNSDWQALKEAGHIGLYNIHRRLKLRYAEKGKLFFKPSTAEGTTAVLVLPK